MTNLTRQEITKAYAALFSLADYAVTQAEDREQADRMRAYNHHILKALPPKPRLTMADIEWDDDKHYLAEATSDQFGRVIMLRKGKEGYIEFIVPGEPECGTLVAYTEYLTPTGRRYTLKEIDND